LQAEAEVLFFGGSTDFWQLFQRPDGVLANAVRDSRVVRMLGTVQVQCGLTNVRKKQEKVVYATNEGIFEFWNWEILELKKMLQTVSAWTSSGKTKVREFPDISVTLYCFLVSLIFKQRTMDTYHLKLEASWDEVKERIKEVCAELTDADLVYEPGQEKELLEKLSKKLNKDIEAIKAWIESVSFTDGIAS